jgi:protein involved in polysaccharide export with SLBB domain
MKTFIMQRKRVFVRLAIVGLTLVTAGCFKADEKNLSAFTYPNKADVTMDQYILQPPDEITVISSSVPELTGGSTLAGSTLMRQTMTQTIRPDGMISFERVGEISVAGKTPRQVAELIAQKLASLYQLTGENPVDVRVNNRSKYYYMIGMVKDPGAKYFSGRETTLSAISKAVITNLAWKDQIQVIRPSLDPTQPSKVFALDYREMSEQGDMTKNVLLQEGDVIYVPPTILATIGLTVNEIVGPILSGGAAYNAVTPTQ